MRLLNIIYLKETDETCDFIKRFIVKIKKVFNIIEIKNEGGKEICYLPLFKKKSISKRKINKFSKKITKVLENNGTSNIVLSEYLSNLEELKNSLYSENINILNGRFLFKCLTEEIIKYILKIKNENIKKSEISILVNDYSEFNQELVMDLAKKVKTLNIVTNHITKWLKVEESLYNEFGILLNISNNKRSSLKSSRIIINIDFPSELINQYKIFNEAIIVNILNKVQIKSKKFNGINVNYFRISIPPKYKMDGFINEIVYESILYKNRLLEARNKITEDKIKIKKLVGNNGYLKENEFNTKHLTKT